MTLYDFPWFRLFYDHIIELSDVSMYYVFVEEVGPTNPEGIMGPDERPLDNNIINENLRDRPWRIRASGIDALAFHQSMNVFEVLDHDNVTNDERRRRKSQLNEVFGGQPLPIFDFYVGSKDADYQYYRNIIVPGAWYLVAVRQQSSRDAALPIFVGAPELPGDLYMPGSLVFWDVVPLRIEYRLRDIFSLVHISDAELGEGTGGSGEPLPPEPGVGPEPSRSEQPDLDPSTLPSGGN